MMDKDLFVSLPHMQRGIEISVCIDFFFFWICTSDMFDLN